MIARIESNFLRRAAIVVTMPVYIVVVAAYGAVCELSDYFTEVVSVWKHHD
jgi:hypothetical protein